MAQILDLTGIYSQEQIETAKASDDQYEEVEAGGYVCKIVDAILNNKDGKANIELHLDIDEGNHKGFFQKLEDRAGFWGLRGYMSFKESQISKFLKTCTAINISNPGFSFDPMKKGGVDVDTLKGKLIGIVIQKEEYKSNSGDIREKCAVYNITEVEKIRNKKFKIPMLKKLVEDVASVVDVPDDAPEEAPFN